VVLATAASLTMGTVGVANAASAGKPGTKATKSPIIVGEDWDSTSASASFTDVTAKTLQLAVNQLNSTGGVQGHPIKLIFGNDESDPTKTPAVTQQLVNSGAKFLLYNTGTDATAKATIEKLGIPAIGVTDVIPTFAVPPDNTYTYLLSSPLSDWASVYCGAWKATGVKTIGVLRDDSTTTASLDDILFPALKKCVNITDVETASGTTSDVTAQVARLKSHNPDAVLVADLGGQFEVLAQEAVHQLMPSTPRYSLATIVNEPTTWTLATPGSLNGVISMGSLNPNNVQTKKLDSFLQSHNGKNYPVTAFDADAWDAVQLMKTAMVAAGGANDPQKVNQQMQAITSYVASFGQPGYTLTYSATKHAGATGLCGLVLQQFGSNNKPTKAFAKYQPSCTKS
jgi:branched-chain amino acid transport system substrate-binding protein